MKKQITPKQLVAAHPDTKVVVKLVMDTDTKKVSVQVSVASNIWRGGRRWTHIKLDADHPKLEYHVQQAAEVMANFQNEIYGDRHNPPGVARAATAGLKDIMKKADRASTRPEIVGDCVKDSE